MKLGRLHVLASSFACSLFAVCVEPDGSISNKLVQTQLEPYAGHYPKGACDLCVDERGRIFAATQLGVQMITVFGMVANWVMNDYTVIFLLEFTVFTPLIVNF